MSAVGLYKFAESLGLHVKFGDELGFKMERLKYGKRVPTISIYISFFSVESGRALGSACADLAHEIGHYFVAPKNRRHRKDYGIPDDSRSNPKYILEEAKAIVVEKYLLEYFRLDYCTKVPKFPLKGRDALDRNITAKVAKEAYAWWNDGGKKELDILLEWRKV